MLEILNLRKTANGFLINGLTETIAGDENYENALDWQAEGKEVMPQYTQAQINEQEEEAAWDAYTDYCSTLTVTTTAGHTFAANPEALKDVTFKHDSILEGVSILWIEEGGPFYTDRVELQEVIVRASGLMQDKIVELFGGV